MSEYLDCRALARAPCTIIHATHSHPRPGIALSPIHRHLRPFTVILGEDRGSIAQVNCGVAGGFPAFAENDEVVGRALC